MIVRFIGFFRQRIEYILGYVCIIYGGISIIDYSLGVCIMDGDILMTL